MKLLRRILRAIFDNWKDVDRHRHDWTYSSPTIGGWGVVTCAICGKKDIY